MRTQADGQDYETRFEALQTRFIDEPREAVREASSLVRHAVDRIIEGDADTERLRRLMQGYRDLLTRIEDGDGALATRSAGVEGRRTGRELDTEPAAHRSAGVEPTAEDRAAGRPAGVEPTTEDPQAG